MKRSALSAAVIVFIVFLTATILLFGMTGCATAPKASAPSFSPPAVSKTWTAVAKARDAARDLEALAPASVRPGIKALSSDLATAQQALSDYAQQVELQTTALTQAENDKNSALLQVAAIEAKRQKALRELWFWRLVILTEIGCVVGWLALRGGIKTFLA